MIRTFRIIAAAFMALLASQHAVHAENGITAETWTNLTPSPSIITLQEDGILDRAPDTTAILPSASFTSPPNAGTGTRFRGTLTPQHTDTYTFWISGKSNVALWISDDGSRFNKKLVAYSLEPSALGEWSKFPTQQSLPIQLTAGQSYYIEAQVMDQYGGGHLEVAWRGLNGRYALDLNGATATQSSRHRSNYASRAIDGDTSGYYKKSTLTNDEANSWLQVDFGQDREINKVVVHNVRDNPASLSNFRVSVLDANNTELIGENFYTTSGYVVDRLIWNFRAPVPGARKIKIQFLGHNLQGNGHLSIAELEAFGPGPIVEREIIGQAYLSPLAPDPDDTNDNNLSDAWEVQTGLAASPHPEALLEYGDPDNDGISNFQEYWLGSDPLFHENIGQGLSRYIWMGIKSSNLSSLTTSSAYYSYANSKDHVPGINDITGRIKYGARYRGFIIAPVTGQYRFWISGGDGESQLWFADGSVVEPGTGNPLTNRFGKTLLASSPANTPLHDFDYRHSQRSVVLNLVEGQQYYIEALQAVTYRGGDHISVAWEYPGQERQIIPAMHFISDNPLSEDADEDNLPDTWESTFGLNPADNGFTNFSESEYGDPDGDRLTNLQEYQAGTNPTNADTDGDGYSDDEELNYYGSDPLTSNNLAAIAVDFPSLQQYSNSTTAWYTDADGALVANERRGAITYTFEVTEPGIHEVGMVVDIEGFYSRNTYYLNLSMTLNDESSPFVTERVGYSHGSNVNIRAITPWLSPGTHSITIYHHNYDASKRLRIESISVNRLGGDDLNEDGVPDWVETSAREQNALTRIPTDSRTSPVSIQGITEHFSSVALSAIYPGAGESDPVELSKSINDSFYADLALDPNAATTLNATFVAGLIAESHDITWTPTNLFEGFSDNSLHIRKGDASLLDAWSGASADGQPFTVTLDGTLLEDANQNTTHISGVPFVSTFDTAGTYTLVATHNGQAASVTLVVHAADFGGSHAVHTYFTRSWTPDLLGLDHVIENDERIVFSETTTNPSTGPRSFAVKAEEPVNRYVIASMPDEVDGAPSAVLARGTVHAFEYGHVGDTGDAQIVAQYPDGTRLIRSTIVGVNLPANALIRLTILQQGSLFSNGSNVLELRAGDFDINGIATVYYETPAGIDPKLCHSSEVFIEY